VTDPFLLNLLCCKQDKAEMLAERGLLVLDADLEAAQGVADPGQREWRQFAVDSAHAPSGRLRHALGSYALSQELGEQPTARLRALSDSVAILRQLCEAEPQSPHWSSLARVAIAFGARAVAVGALDRLVQMLGGGQIAFNQPFLPPNEDAVTEEKGGDRSQWLLRLALAALERQASFSSFYSPSASCARLERLNNLGYLRPEMARRFQMVRRRLSPLSS
jgi:hypothetical protein